MTDATNPNDYGTLDFTDKNKRVCIKVDENLYFNIFANDTYFQVVPFKDGEFLNDQGLTWKHTYNPR